MCCAAWLWGFCSPGLQTEAWNFEVRNNLGVSGSFNSRRGRPTGQGNQDQRGRSIRSVGMALSDGQSLLPRQGVICTSVCIRVCGEAGVGALLAWEHMQHHRRLRA